MVAFWQPHVPSMSAGLEVANVLPEKQLLTEFIVPNTPPSSPMSYVPEIFALPVMRLSDTRSPEDWKYTVSDVGGNGSGRSRTSTPNVGLSRIVLSSIRSA